MKRSENPVSEGLTHDALTSPAAVGDDDCGGQQGDTPQSSEALGQDQVFHDGGDWESADLEEGVATSQEPLVAVGKTEHTCAEVGCRLDRAIERGTGRHLHPEAGRGHAGVLAEELGGSVEGAWLNLAVGVEEEEEVAR